jgi:hypothetical protein
MLIHRALDESARGCEITVGSQRKVNRLPEFVCRAAQLLSLPGHADVCLVYAQRSCDRMLAPASNLRQNRRHLQCPAMGGGAVDKDAALCHQWVVARTAASCKPGDRIGRIVRSLTARAAYALATGSSEDEAIPTARTAVKQFGFLVACEA